MNKPLPNRFQIQNELGQGGTSVVYAAHDSDTQTDVAVKLLLSKEESERFRLEASTLASLSHPNIVRYLEVGSHEDCDFLVMECLPDGDLDDRVNGADLTEILEVFLPICDGLSYLHERGLVHRDIKPSNILFGPDGQPRIADLGLARHVEERMQLTQAGAIVGSYSYMAPEQIICSQVGPSADLYSLGVCLFKALTGERPFRSTNDFAMLKAHLQDQPPSLRDYLPEASDALVKLVSDMLAKSEEDRPPTACDVADRLLQCIQTVVTPKANPVRPELEQGFEELSDDRRSLLLVLAHLGEQGDFERVCAISAYAEDGTDRIIEELIQTGYITADSEDFFHLNISRGFLKQFLTPRMERLYERRLSRYMERFEIRRPEKSKDPVWLAESSFEEFDFGQLDSSLSRRAS